MNTTCQHPAPTVIEIDPSEIWAVSYSTRQGFFDVCNLAELCGIHMHEIENGYSNGYVLLNVCGTMEEAMAICDELGHRIDEAMKAHPHNNTKGVN